MAWRAHVDQRPWMGTERLFIARDAGDRRALVHPFTLTTIENGMVAPDDLVALDESGTRSGEVRDFLQAMMDCAYEIGLRPSRAQDERHLKKHLEDMRRLAFRTIIKEEPR